MSDKEIIIIRHGETDFNRQRIVQGSGVDSDLNETGRMQADQFYNYYKDYGFDHIFCSLLKRSYQTIQKFSGSTPIIRLSDLDEISWGSQEGRQSTPQTIRAYKQVVGQWSKGNMDAHLPGGESASHMFARMKRVKIILEEIDSNRILICTHGRSMRTLMCVLFDQPARYMEEYAHDNTCVYKVGYFKGEFILLLKNDVSHLKK